MRATDLRTALEHRVARAGGGAWAAWAAFAELATHPVYDPIEAPDVPGQLIARQAWDDDVLLFIPGHGTLVFDEAAGVEREKPDPAQPPVLTFDRELVLRDRGGDRVGNVVVQLAIVFEPSPALASAFDAPTVEGAGGPPWDDAVWDEREEEPRPFAAGAAWVAEVEGAEAFTVARRAGVVRRYAIREQGL